MKHKKEYKKLQTLAFKGQNKIVSGLQAIAAGKRCPRFMMETDGYAMEDCIRFFRKVIKKDYICPVDMYDMTHDICDLSCELVPDEFFEYSEIRNDPTS
jgi:hypothetical protein